MNVAQLTDIKCGESGVALEDLHIQLSGIGNIALADLHKPAESSTTSPAVVKQVACEGIEDHIDAFTIGCGHDGR